GAPGLRDEDPLASALARLQQQDAYGESPDVVRLAALYTDAILRNHPFIDGNERVGFVVGVLFLELHGYAFTSPRALAAHAVLDLAAGRSNLEGYERFLRDHAQPAREP
ncbi:MAG: type II toxin-antitoxin system death-on-curing family toxin, partial [Trueperaceae bacterium]|nr:type II toxin-antitoxin system death-on-curing family toxin [Trueperaceae bacterium]